MKPEKIFNIFPICNNDIISLIGFRVHEKIGTDDEKIEFLLSRIETDITELAYIKISDNFKVKLPNGDEVNGLTHERFNNLLQNGTESILYEPIFQLFDAPEFPLSVSTMLVDGEIKITRQEKFETDPKTKVTESLTENVAEHYLEKYLTDEGFDFTALVNDDFLDAIKLLFKNQKYVSATKLLMAAIDTFAFLEYGDTKDNFKKWLTSFCDLSSIKLTVDELWEYRNSILHMTNAQSRKVIQNQIERLSFYVSENDIDFLTTNGEAKYFNLLTLIRTINLGIVNWINTYDTDRSKFEIFSDRYDLIISDSRYNKIQE
jgi:hypothetical protein